MHRYRWDGEGRLTDHTDPLGAVTRWRYNGAGDVLEREDALGQRLRYEYDAGGRMVALVNENGERITFRHDVLDRLTDEIGVDGRHQRYVYNPAGELIHMVERGGSDLGPGKVTRFERDALGRLTRRWHEGALPLERASADVRFAYDPLGRMVQAENAVAQVQFTYDPLGQLLSETQHLQVGSARTVFRLSHGHDPLGNRVSTTLPDGRTLNTLFYGAGHWHQINVDGQVVSDVERDALHREVRRTQGALQTQYVHDAGGRLRGQRVLPAGRAAAVGEAGLIERRYDYDAAGQLQRILDRYRGENRYEYDLVGRIVRGQIGLGRDWGAAGTHWQGVALAADERFAWDPASNPVPVDVRGGGCRWAGSGQPAEGLAGHRLRV